MQKQVHELFQGLALPEAPEQWARQEQRLAQHVRAARGQVLLHDDRVPDVVWKGVQEDLTAYLESSIANDAVWDSAHQYSFEDAQAW